MTVNWKQFLALTIFFDIFRNQTTNRSWDLGFIRVTCTVIGPAYLPHREEVCELLVTAHARTGRAKRCWSHTQLGKVFHNCSKVDQEAATY